MKKDDDLKIRLKIAKKKITPKKDPPAQSNLGQAFKMSTELVSAVLVGTIIGFILDRWFDTKPWLIIIFFFLGAAAGMLNVIRLSLIHISEPTRQEAISYAVFCLKKKK